MKKKIFLQLKTLANQIIASEENIDIKHFKNLVTQLLEQLTILEYLESHQESHQDRKTANTIESSALDSKSYREEHWFEEPKPVPQPQHGDELAEPLIEKIKDIVAQMPYESQEVDKLLEKVLPNLPTGNKGTENTKNELEEFAEHYQEMPVFERKETNEKPNTPFPESNKIIANQPRSLNDKIIKGLQIGLNDRLAFIKHLFNDKADEYTRVLSQLNTLNSFDEAETFIKGKVKPDYNYWLEKDKYSERFMTIIEKSFN